MNNWSPAVFRQNRAKFSLDELRKVDGQWVAFSLDGIRIVASAADLNELAERLRMANEKVDNVALEHIELESSVIYSGSAELT